MLGVTSYSWISRTWTPSITEDKISISTTGALVISLVSDDEYNANSAKYNTVNLNTLLGDDTFVDNFSFKQVSSVDGKTFHTVDFSPLLIGKSPVFTNENVKERLDETEKKLNEYMESISDTDKTIQLLQQEVSELNVVSGLTEVKGKGIIITVKDAEVLNPLYLAEDQIVHDNDLLQIVNELRAGGAEAISINNQRLTALSAIRCVGPSILVNDVKIGAPFVIKAIGNVDYLYSGINLSGGVVDIMRKYGISIEVERSENVVIPKYEGSIKISQGN